MKPTAHEHALLFIRARLREYRQRIEKYGQRFPLDEGLADHNRKTVEQFRTMLHILSIATAEDSGVARIVAYAEGAALGWIQTCTMAGDVEEFLGCLRRLEQILRSYPFDEAADKIIETFDALHQVTQVPGVTALTITGKPMPSFERIFACNCGGEARFQYDNPDSGPLHQLYCRSCERGTGWFPKEQYKEVLAAWHEITKQPVPEGKGFIENLKRSPVA